MRTLILSLAVIASATAYAQSATFQRGELVRVLPPTAPSESNAPVLDPDALNNQNILEHWGQHFGGPLERAPK